MMIELVVESIYSMFVRMLVIVVLVLLLLLWVEHWSS